MGAFHAFAPKLKCGFAQRGTIERGRSVAFQARDLEKHHTRSSVRLQGHAISSAASSTVAQIAASTSTCAITKLTPVSAARFAPTVKSI
jgi:hypothetical protein